MLYVGNNVALAGMDNAVSAKKDKIAEIREDIRLFSEQELICKQRLHYVSMCADLANEDDPGFVSFLTGLISNGTEGVASLEVEEANKGFLLETVEKLVSNFEEAASQARSRVREKAERAKNTQQNNVYAQTTREGSQNTAEADIQAVNEAQNTLDNAISSIESSDFGKKLASETTKELDKAVNEGPTIDDVAPLDAKSVENVETADIQEKNTKISADTEITAETNLPSIDTLIKE